MTKNQEKVAIFLVRSHHRRWIAEEDVLNNVEFSVVMLRRIVDTLIQGGLAEEKIIDTKRKYEISYRLTPEGRRIARKRDTEPWGITFRRFF